MRGRWAIRNKRWVGKVMRGTQSGIVHALYQLNALPFLRTLKETPQKHGKRTFCTRCYHLGHIKKNCPYYQCLHCSLHWPCDDEEQCLGNLQLYKKKDIIIKQEPPSPPPLRIPPPQVVQKPRFPPTEPNHQNSNSSSSFKSSNRITKRGWKGKKPERKKI